MKNKNLDELYKEYSALASELKQTNEKLSDLIIKVQTDIIDMLKD